MLTTDDEGKLPSVTATIFVKITSDPGSFWLNVAIVLMLWILFVDLGAVLVRIYHLDNWIDIIVGNIQCSTKCIVFFGGGAFLPLSSYNTRPKCYIR